MADTPDESKDDDALPDIQIWLGDRFNDDTIAQHIRVEEIPTDDPHFEMESDDDFNPNAVDNEGEEIEIVEVVIRVFRRRKAG